MDEEFEDTKGVIRIRKLKKDKQHNDQGSSSKVDVEITGKFRLFDFFGDAGLLLEKNMHFIG
jgi:hypothetical protein